jgi:hypothetical protein
VKKRFYLCGSYHLLPPLLHTVGAWVRLLWPHLPRPTVLSDLALRPQFMLVGRRCRPCSTPRRLPRPRCRWAPVPRRAAPYCRITYPARARHPAANPTRRPAADPTRPKSQLPRRRGPTPTEAACPPDGATSPAVTPPH